MKLNKAIIFSLAIVQAASSLASGVENTMVKGMEQNLGEVIKDVAEGLSSAAPLLEAVATGVQVFSIGKDVVHGAQAVHSYVNPSEAQQAADIKTRITLEYFKSAQSYRTCMVSNAKAPSRTSSGFPASCNGLEQAYAAMAGGRKEVDKMKQSFKKYDTGELCSGKEDNGYSTTQKVLMGGAVGVVVVGVAVVAAPYVLPASTYAAAQAAAATVSAKASAVGATVAAKATTATAITKAQAVVEVAKLANTYGRPYVCPSEEQQVQQLSHQRAIQRSFSGEIKEAFAKK